jgi:3-hydroxybutyryl-CoA dehydrogenase
MEFRHIGILGGGKMAAEIFKLLSEKDVAVTLWVRRQEQVEGLDEELKRKLKRRAKKSGEDGQKAQAQLERLKVTSELADLVPCDLVIESIIEAFQPKRAVLQQLDRVIGSSCVVATNSSGLSPTSLASSMSHPERFLGVHFFYPVSILTFVEVAPGRDTLPEVADRVTRFLTECGKHPVRVLVESAGNIVNRILLSYYNEGGWIVSEGAWLPGEVDRIAKRFALMGPCESADQVGLDFMLQARDAADESWGEKDHVLKKTRGMKPYPEIYQALVDRGAPGARTGLGYFRYENRVPVEDPERIRAVQATLADFGRCPKGDEKAVELRLISSLIMESLNTLLQGVGSRDDIDYCIKEVVGLDKGPLAMLDEFGIENWKRIARNLEKDYGVLHAPFGILAD